MLICRLHVGGVCETWFTPSLHRGLYRNRGIERSETESAIEFGWGLPHFQIWKGYVRGKLLHNSLPVDKHQRGKNKTKGNEDG